jgi:NDP-sugar pyrophosphorylase family protein
MTQIVIPMAGRGQRFVDAGYKNPKPFIDVAGKTMVDRVMQNLPDGDTTFVTLEAHREQVEQMDDLAALHCGIVIRLTEVTAGAACTVLEGIDHLTHHRPSDGVIVANSDQFIDWNPEHFLSYMQRFKADGGIATFRASGAKWSYADVKENGIIAAVAEKIPISRDATCGVYYFKNALILKNAILQMMAKNIKTNGEFYLAPVYNEMITDGMKILNYPVPRMYGMGTPEDLAETLCIHNENGIF